MGSSHQWSYERLLDALDVIAQSSGHIKTDRFEEPYDVDHQLKSMVQASVPPLMLYPLRYDSDSSNDLSHDDTDFDRFTQPIRENVLAAAAMFGQIKREWLSSQNRIDGSISQSPPSWFKAMGSGGDQTESKERQWYRRSFQAKRLRWHIQAWGLGILSYPEMRPICRCASWGDITIEDWGSKYAWDLPDLSAIAWNGLGTRLGNEKAAVEVIQQLGPRGRNGKLMVAKVSIEYGDIKYPFSNSLAAKSFRLGKEDKPHSKLGHHHLLGREFTSDYSHAKVSVEMAQNFEPDSNSESNRAKPKWGVDCWHAYADCWNSFKRDLEGFWKPKLFPAWLRVDFRYTVNWPGFNALGRFPALLGDGFTLRNDTENKTIEGINGGR